MEIEVFFAFPTLTADIFGVQRRNVPHLKGLISGNLEVAAQGRDSTFVFCHAL